LPSLLPLLVSRPKEDNSYEEEESNGDDEINKGSYKFRAKIREPRKRGRFVDSYWKPYSGIKRRGGFIPRFRGRKIKKNYY
jgi:hypothetical protein